MHSLVVVLQNRFPLRLLMSEYSCETWNPHTKRNIDKLESVQRRATRWITKSDDDYNLRLSKLKLLSLFNRRFIRDTTWIDK